MKKIIITVFVSVIITHSIFAQSVGIGTLAPDSSALLDLTSTTQGFLPPRVTASQKTAILKPKSGLLVYQTDGTKGLYVYDGTTWAVVSSAVSGWSLTGNANTSTTKNFIGTTDNKPLAFRVNKINAGKLDPIYANSSYGIHTLDSNTTGYQNTAVGVGSLNNNTTGSDNNAMGAEALFSNLDGKANVAIGSLSLRNNKNGNDNIAIGHYSLYNNVGSGNIGAGLKALYLNTSGFSNVAIGTNALYFNSIQSNNVAIGDSALLHTGQNAKSPIQGASNVAVGSKALYSNTSGFGNTAQGTRSPYSNVTGVLNSAFGAAGLEYCTSGSGNTSFGSYALAANTTGSLNTGIGLGTNTAYDSLINATAIGANAEVGCSDCMVLGSLSSADEFRNGVNVGIGVTIPVSKLHIKQSGETYPVNGSGLRLEKATTNEHWELGVDYGNDFNFVFNGVAKGYINDVTGVYTVVSDLRLKKDISLLGSVIPSLMQLQAKKYHYKDNKAGAELSYGFIAQDVEKIFPDFVTTKGPDNFKAIGYQNFTVLAIKAIQEQQFVIGNQAKQISELEAKMEHVLKLIAK